MDRHLVEVVGAPALEGHQLPDVREVNMEHIAIQGHFPHIGPHVGNARLGHAFPDQRLLLRRHHDMKMDTAAAFLCHRSSRSRLLCLLGAASPCPDPFPGAGAAEPGRCSKAHIVSMYQFRNSLFGTISHLAARFPSRIGNFLLSTVIHCAGLAVGVPLCRRLFGFWDCIFFINTRQSLS